jgi:hypothetical protein
MSEKVETKSEEMSEMVVEKEKYSRPTLKKFPPISASTGGTTGGSHPEISL